MQNIQSITDKTAISLSLLCAIHCLAFPLLVVLSPSIGALNLNDEAFHLWMLLAVIPTSLYALTLGCKKHKRYGLAALTSLGLFIMIMAVIGESILGEKGEKILTVIGAAVVASGHFWNYRMCRHQDDCGCHSHEKATD